MTITEQFERFDREHPEVYTEFVRQAKRVRRRGFQHYSARTIVSVMRFEADVDGRPEDRFRINDHWSPYYARKLMAEDPTFQGFFELRVVQGVAA